MNPAVINRVPYGLLNYFGLQSGGTNPNSVDPVVQASLDAWTWYNWRDRYVTVTSNNFTAVNTGFLCNTNISPWFDASGILNQGYACEVHRIGVVSTNAATLTALQYVIQVNRNANNAGGGPIALPLAVSTTAGASQLVAATWEGLDLVLRPGERIGTNCIQYAGSGISAAVAVCEMTLWTM